MLNDSKDLSDYIREIISPELPNHVKELLGSRRLARRIEADLIPDGMVNTLCVLSPISDDPENRLNYLFGPISNARESSSHLQYKKRIMFLEREIEITEENRRNDKPLIELGRNAIARNEKRVETLRESCTKYTEKDKVGWVKEAERIKQGRSSNISASALALLIVKNLGLLDKAYESIRKHLLTKGIKAHQKKKSKSS